MIIGLTALVLLVHIPSTLIGLAMAGLLPPALIKCMLSVELI